MSLYQFEAIDNPWRRLPWVLFSAVLIWGALLWGFGLFLGQMAEEPKELKPIDAELIEVPLPAKPITVPKPPKPEPIRQAAPPAPHPVKQTTTPSPSQEQPVIKPIVQTSAPSTRPQASSPLPQSTTQAPSPTESVVKSPALSVPVVSLPETNLPDAGYAGMTQSAQHHGPASNEAASATIQPGFGTHAKISPEVSGGSITPPQFGGAAYLSNPKPVYPALAKRMGLEGTVRLKVLVSREGSALKIEIIQSSGHEILDRAAAEAVKKWRFTPAHQGDFPVEDWVLIPVAFRLEK